MTIHERRRRTAKRAHALQLIALTLSVQAIGVVLLLGFFDLN